MGRYLCSTKEESKYWLNWSFSGITTCIVIHGIFISTNIIIAVIHVTLFELKGFLIHRTIERIWIRVLLLVVFEFLAVLSQWSHVKCNSILFFTNDRCI